MLNPPWRDSNWGPLASESNARPTELIELGFSLGESWLLERHRITCLRGRDEGTAEPSPQTTEEPRTVARSTPGAVLG